MSRTENPELFSLVIGGYGMYGVILDVTLKVTKDELYEQRAASVDYKDFPAYFRGQRARPTPAWCSCWCGRRSIPTRTSS